MRLKIEYEKEIAARLMSKLSLKNQQVPKLKKIVLNMGWAKASVEKNQACNDDMALITGQKPIITKFKNQFQI